MHVTRLRISNFRSIKYLDMPLSRTTVLIGPNNSGKTAILEALRIALTRRWGQRGTGFTEYDYHLGTDDSDPKTAPPITIEVELSESAPGEWGEDLQAELEYLIQADPHTGRSAILLRVTCAWNEAEESYTPKWEFLTSERKPAAGKAAKLTNMNPFFEFIPVFYLDALRDADDEFSARSQFWGKLLRSVNIPSNLTKRSQQVFDRLNRRLLDADPKIAKIASKLEGINKVAAEDSPGSADVRLMPLKTWDLLSRSQVILKTTATHPWLPLKRHGRGVQSLSVVFLFHAFVEELLAELFRNEAEPLLALEEPETHLHPQASRSLWTHIRDLPGQKLVTTHSPYFVQNVPFRDLRLIRTNSEGTTFSSLPDQFDVEIPFVPPLGALVTLPTSALSYDHATRRLVCHGAMKEKTFRSLLQLYAKHDDAARIVAELKALYAKSQKHVSDHVLRDLEEWARRIRGEIFFAKRWLLVEGQSDYLIAHAIGEALGYPLDANGVSVIDCVNHGNPPSFAMLARGLDIPWCAVFDNDPKGLEYIANIKSKGFDDGEIGRRCSVYSVGDLEMQLVHQGNGELVREIAIEIGAPCAPDADYAQVVKAVQARSKIPFAIAVCERLGKNPALVESMPDAMVTAIRSLHTLD